MKAKKFLYFFSFGCIQIFIACIAFLDFRLHPANIIFFSSGDGLKNYFTLLSYIKEPLTADGLLKYNSFSYPFGDYVYYTDNTPLFSIPFRWYCHHISDVSAYTLPVYNTIVILNVILCGFLLLYVLRYLLKENFLSFIMAIILSWANIMLLRITNGNYSLSLSSLIIVPMCLMIMWDMHKNNSLRLASIFFTIIIFTFLAFLAHGYYLAIIMVFAGAMFFFYGIQYRKDRIGKISIAVAVIYPILSLGFTLWILKHTDQYLHLRKATANGYYYNQKIYLNALITHSSVEKIFFPVSATNPINDMEKQGYLGNIALYALPIILIVAMCYRAYRPYILSKLKTVLQHKLILTLLAGATITLFVAMGEHAQLSVNDSEGMVFINPLNPFLYLHYITNRVEQFRSLARFVWPFIFCFNIAIVYLINLFFQDANRKRKTLILVLILFFGGTELVDYVGYNQDCAGRDNDLDTAHINTFIPLHINFSNYQAILPIPFYLVGSEDYDYTLNDNDPWSNYTFRLSLYSKLPLMSCKMSRTPPLYSRMLMNIVAKDSMAPLLYNKLSAKPILVAVNKKDIRDSSISNIPVANPQKDLYWKSTTFASRRHLIPVDSMGDVVFYNWYPKS
ncbi:MAG: hypothetical protein H0X33_05130 [Taibaiella sp.]|nr:hypothetical protein [Taibaiella sp.]